MFLINQYLLLHQKVPILLLLKSFKIIFFLKKKFKLITIPGIYSIKKYTLKSSLNDLLYFIIKGKLIDSKTYFS